MGHGDISTTERFANLTSSRRFTIIFRGYKLISSSQQYAGHPPGTPQPDVKPSRRNYELVWIHLDPNPKRKTPSTTTSPACTPTSSVRERGSKVKPTFISPYRIEYRMSIPDVLPFASHHRIYQSNTPDSMPFLQMGWRIVRDGRGGKVGWSWHMAWRRMAWFCYVSVYHHCLYKVEKEWAGGHCRSSVFDSQAHGRREKGKESEGFTHSLPAGVPLN